MTGNRFPRIVTVWLITFVWIAAVAFVVALRLT